MADADKLEQRIADLERELRLRDERIRELKDEVDEGRELVHRMEEHVQERDEYLETFVTTFGMELGDDGCWRWASFVTGYNAMVDKFNELRDRYNSLIRAFHRYALPPRPVGRPIAASEAQQAQVLKLRQRGMSLRGIAEETSLGLPTVRTIVDKRAGTDRTTAKHRQQLGLEPKPKDWRPAALKRLPQRASKHFEQGRELLKEAKGLK